ncbi:Nucleoporin [Tolypocladium ophioglossoides CBS 100239]|uniref:Nucleoporin n=1 Tax=Tolypocladium ophioglossoides (strain CBS 100239) TaxID=1163406 RepID=A0A0L0NKL4_TOLOC|nr:Nucleoporin [Tolypocladium ophioglossoides CBS 100239]
MAFGFGNSGNATGGSAAGGANLGPDLETIQTEALGFLSVAGDAKVRLTSTWPSLPAPTSSLLSIAPRTGLVAAAGPDQLIVGRTEAVRKAFESPKDGESDIRPFEPQLKISMPMRVAQLAFTADENYLVLSAEIGGGLAVYEIHTILQGSSNSTFELSTNGEALRSLIPNPTSEKAELCAIVTEGGNLHMANLKERRCSGILKSQVSCISWSTKGKQLCAGLADGTIHQMTPEGEAKGEIPKSPSLGNCHVSSLAWLENNLFLAIYTATNESPPSSVYHIITRDTPSSFTFQKIADPVEPFVLDKVPHHSILRLKDFPPDLSDLLIVSSTASTEVGLLSRSKAPLASDKPANSITGVFTTTELLDDTKRPTLPMTDSMEDSTPIGIALDLSSKGKVYKPIPADEELEESPGPLAGLWVLTHEGVLCSWWVVYTDSIKKGTTYPGFSAIEGAPSTSTPSQAAPAASASPFSNPCALAFGSSATPAPAFGASAQLGQKSSPWGAAAPAPTATPSNVGGATFGSSTFGSSPVSGPAFGKPSTMGFGQSSQLGMRTSPWAAGGTGPAFGQSGFSSFAKNGNNQSPFGAAPASPSSGGGFAGFSNQGGFASVAENSGGGGASVLGTGSKLSSNPFASTGDSSASLGNVFAPKESKPAGGLFGSTPFKLESSFKPDPSQSENNEKPPATSGSSMFDSAFGSALDEPGNKPRASTPPAKDEDMDTAEPTERQTSQAASSSMFSPQSNEESTTPTTTPAPTRFGLTPSPAPGTSLFGQPTKLGSSGGSGGLFRSTTETPKLGGYSGFFSKPKDTPEDKAEPETLKINVEKLDEPLPPDTMSKAAYLLGESSSSSVASNNANLSFGSSTTPSKPEDAPLPPDFTTTPKATKPSGDAPRPAIPDAPQPPDPTTSKPASKADDAPLPPDFVLPRAPSKESSDVPSVPDDGDDGSDLGEDNASEGSGVDVAKDLSPSTIGLMPTPSFTPQSSFGGLGGTTPATARGGQDRSRPLFGEISRNAPMFPRPTATSPRSPSPVRGTVPQRIIRSDATRSVSAPGMASQILGPKKSQSHLGGSIISKEKLASAKDQFLLQHRKMKERQEAEEAQPLVDEEDDEVQKVLASEVEGSLELDEFIAHSNVAPPANDSVPSQVEAVYRDINSMIDTLGLNARTVKAFTKGHREDRKEEGRTKHDLEMPDDWVLCEVSELGDILDNELYGDLEDGRAQDLEDKLDACQDLARDMQRLRAKQEDLKRVIMTRLDPDQVEVARTLPLSAEQAAQQNELRREVANFTKLLAQAEEALTLLKTRMAAATGSSARGAGNVPTVEAVMRTIAKMTSMAEKRSGDVDVLETQLRKLRLASTSREGSPMVTPQAKKSIMMSPESTPSRNFRQSFSGSVISMGAAARATSPRKKLSGFSKEEKGDLMEKRARRRAVLAKFRNSVEKKGVNVWNMEDIE